MKICLFDPSLQDNNGTISNNLGDIFIQEAVIRELKSIFGEFAPLHISTHAIPPYKLIFKANLCNYRFVGGTNLLSSNMDKYRQLRISSKKMLLLKSTVLLGVGWYSYQKSPNYYSKIFLRFLLSSKLFHSVRDNYTKEKLNNAGIFNVINTGCPTMWPLANYTSESFSQKKSENVLITLTDYSQNYLCDKKLIQIVSNSYRNIYFWPQGHNDIGYLKRLNFNLDKFTILNRTKNDFESFINGSIDFDYVGTRLHAGIKCLLAGKRAIILEVDNRSAEIAKDTGLPTIKRDKFDMISDRVLNPKPIKIRIDTDTINSWKAQFLNV